MPRPRMRNDAVLRRLRFTWPLLYMLCILTLSSVPGQPDPDSGAGAPWWLPAPEITNLLHLPVYAGLAALWTLALASAPGRTLRRACGTAFAISTGFGIFDELYQGLIPGRETALGDALMNTLGAALAVGLLFWIGTRRART